MARQFPQWIRGTTPPQKKVVLMRGHNLHLALVRHLRQNVLVQLRVSCAREAFLAIGTEA